ncbi:MAG: AAA family ATPase [Gallionellaceae bacterium]
MARALSQQLAKQGQLISALLNPNRYPHPVIKVRVIETHISWVLLAGHYAYKIKKALDLGFINTATLKSRQQDCAEEIRLNRRLAAHLYLEVVSIGGSHTQPVWGERPAIEYAVKMHRFASFNTWDRLIVKDKISIQHIDELANTLAHFHMSLPASQLASSAEFSAGMHKLLVQNFSQLFDLLNNTQDANTLTELQRSSEQLFSHHRQHIEARHTQGFIRECHGDLHLGNIALINKQATPFDCIDFNPVLRHIDVMDEVAFVYMDLLHHRHAPLAHRFLNAYIEVTGDYAGVALLNFYTVYRATVRAKISAINASQASIKTRKKLSAIATCRDYLSLASATHARPQLIITHGLPGSGKSTFAQTALEKLGAIRLRSDVERKRLFGLSSLERSKPEQDIYTPEATQRTFAHLLSTTRTLLNAGHSVIVDAAFLKHSERKMFKALASELEVTFAIASMQADTATLRARIIQRQHNAKDASEAGLEVLNMLSKVQEPLTAAELLHCLKLTD